MMMMMMMMMMMISIDRYFFSVRSEAGLQLQALDGGEMAPQMGSDQWMLPLRGYEQSVGSGERCRGYLIVDYGQ